MSDERPRSVPFFSIALRWLPFLAVLFAAGWLWRTGTVTGFRCFDVLPCLGSVGLLLGSFALRGVVWHRLLRRVGVDASLRHAAGAHFKPTLAKYVPGKVWTVLGTAHLLGRYGISIPYGSFLHLLNQFVLSTSGIIVGLVGLLVFESPLEGSPVVWLAAGLPLVTVLVFLRSRPLPRRLVRWYEGRTSRSVPLREIPPLGSLLLASMVHWAMMGAAFWLFWRSLGLETGPSPILLQPLAINIGVLAFFTPAGLGVREGLMIGYLTMAGLGAPDAAAAAIASRLWFFGHECVLFLVGAVLDRGGDADQSSGPPEGK